MLVTELDAEFLRAQIEHGSSIGDIIIFFKSVGLLVFHFLRFPRWRGANPSVWGKYYLARFLPEIQENERNIRQRGEVCP